MRTHTASSSGSPGPGRARRIASLAAVGAFLSMLALPAHALTVDDVRPGYFDPILGYGLEPVDGNGVPLVPNLSATAQDLWISAPSPAIEIAQQILVVHSNPSNPTPADPTILDSMWTVTNVGAGNLVAPLLVFTSLDPLGSLAVVPRQGLDLDLLQLLAYSFDNTDYVFGAAQLPDLAQGASAAFTLRYVIASDLPTDSGGQMLAPLGVSVLGSYTVVPEPSTSALLLLGLTLSFTASRSSNRSSIDSISPSLSARGLRRRRVSKRSGVASGGTPL